MSSENTYAIVQIGGHQYRLQAGQIVKIPKLTDKKAGDKLVFDQVLLVGSEDTEPTLGAPFVKGAKVTASLLANSRAGKIVVFKKKRRKGHRKKIGFRAEQSEVKIESINF